MHLSQKDHNIAIELISDIDSKGYLLSYSETRDRIIATLDVKPRKVGDILKIIQTLEPDGVGARSLKECLLIQIEQYDFDSELLREMIAKVVKDFLTELGEGKIEKIAQSLSIEEEGVLSVAEFIKSNLSPNPGARFSQTEVANHVVPSFAVNWVDDKMEISNLEKEKGIKVSISDRYQKILSDPKLDEESKKFLEEKYKKALEFVENIRRRQETMGKLAKYILYFQKDFVKKGDNYLLPLLQKDVAEYLSVSNSTVSRIVSSKYLQTANGIFSFKHLCPRNHFGHTEYRFKEIVKDILAENPGLSDQKISDLLGERGINIARRTVTKYRHITQKEGMDS